MKKICKICTLPLVENKKHECKKCKHCGIVLTGRVNKEKQCRCGIQHGKEIKGYCESCYREKVLGYQVKYREDVTIFT